ncbi:hypothetical protein JAAARDRAFT_601749 [Jaapia argillacea MUCL 33604]|uniref:N-acetyltransferase domain-containing protein n=1 Tax=Jaapia argillacea MUCL 33604 TaxID=933084 RepID=A0A067Q2B0_9AGAM|nr:hypothetical protein JAAARDRAFT_601749 [Jaapia argillacea MUCL 33604]
MASGKEIGHVNVQIINPSKTQGFFDDLDSKSQELAKLALLFDDEGHLLPGVGSAGTGCWRPEDFWNDGDIVYVEEIVVESKYRGMGVGSWVYPRLLELEELKRFHFLIAWPTVLNHLELDSGAFSDASQEAKDAFPRKLERLAKFHRKVGFRRLGNSFFFCLAKDEHHASRSIPAEDDALYEDPPLPRTVKESARVFLADH